MIDIPQGGKKALPRDVQLLLHRANLALVSLLALSLRAFLLQRYYVLVHGPGVTLNAEIPM